MSASSGQVADESGERLPRIVHLIGDIDNTQIKPFNTAIIDYLSKGRTPITVLISTEGGGVDAGQAIIDMIDLAQKNEVQVIGRVHGFAYSMGAWILQACQRRESSPEALLMVHGISFSYPDSLDERYLTADQGYRAHFKRLAAQRFAERAKGKWKSLDFWTKVMDDNLPRYYNAERALAMGLIDAIK